MIYNKVQSIAQKGKEEEMSDKELVYRCEKCGSTNVRMMTNMLVSFPANWEGELTSKRRSDPEFEIWGVNWSGREIICRDCRFTEKGPNRNPWIEIERLQDRIRQLEEDVEKGNIEKKEGE